MTRISWIRPVVLLLVFGVGLAIPSAAQAAVTTPSWVEELSATGSTASITVKFRPPASDGGDSNLSYQTSLDDGQTWSSLTTTTGADGFITGTITGLASSKSYSIQVTAVNSAGRGVGSSTTASTTGPVLPKAPTITEMRSSAVEGSYTKSDVTIGWERDLSVDPADVTDYTVQYSADGTSWQTLKTGGLTSTSTTATIADLAVGTEYSFRVSVLAKGVSSEWSTVFKRMVQGAVEPATQVVARRSDNGSSAQITFVTPAPTPARPAGGSYVQYRLVGATTWTRSLNAVNGAVTLTDLAPFSTYEYRVVSSNSIGATVTSVSQVAGVRLPAVPGSLTVTGENSTGKVQWNAPADPGTSPLLGFDISTDGGATWRDSGAAAGAGGSYSLELRNLTAAGTTLAVASRTLVGRGTATTVTVRSQPLDLGTLTDLSIDAQTRTLEGTNASATYSVSPASICTLAGTTITLVAVGACTVTATLAGSTTPSVVTLPAASTATFNVTETLIKPPTDLDLTFTGTTRLGTRTVEIVWTAPAGLVGEQTYFLWIGDNAKGRSYIISGDAAKSMFFDFPGTATQAKLCFGSLVPEACTALVKVKEPLKKLDFKLTGKTLSSATITKIKAFAKTAQAARKVIRIVAYAPTETEQRAYQTAVRKVLGQAGYTQVLRLSRGFASPRVILSVSYDR